MNVQAFDNQGRPVAGTGAQNGNNNNNGNNNSGNNGNTGTTPEQSNQNGNTGNNNNAGNNSGGIGNFGSCSVPQIEFGVGFDNRRETSFQPVDKGKSPRSFRLLNQVVMSLFNLLASYNHGSAQAVAIITRFMCDQLVNSCGADQTARDTCARATTAASAAAAKTGAQADAFNAVFGITTNFASVQPIDDQGRPVGTTGSGNANNGNTGNNNTGNNNNNANNGNNNNNNNGNNNNGGNTGNNNNAGAGGNLQTFTEALGGVNPPVVTALGDGRFQVQGNAAFNNVQNALARSW